MHQRCCRHRCAAVIMCLTAKQPGEHGCTQLHTTAPRPTPTTSHLFVVGCCHISCRGCARRLIERKSAVSHFSHPTRSFFRSSQCATTLPCPHTQTTPPTPPMGATTSAHDNTRRITLLQHVVRGVGSTYLAKRCSTHPGNAQDAFARR